MSSHPISAPLRATLVLSAGALLLGACHDSNGSSSNSGGPPSSTLELHDATAEAGLVLDHTPPSSVFTSPMLAAGAAGDFDRDGWQDLFVVMGGDAPDRLFINNRDGTFREEGAAWGVDRTHVGGGVAVGDFNADGWLDMYVMSYGTVADGMPAGQNLLYRNNGDGTFSEIAQAAGVATTSPAMGDGYGTAWGDYDLDGDLDLMTTGWEGGSDGNRLFRNEGDETFTDVTLTAIAADLSTVRGFSPRFLDMDGDRYPEILLTGDFRTSIYLVNNGDGTFRDETSSAQVNKESNGMGQAVGDLDNDGLIDWFVTSIHSEVLPNVYFGNKLYRNMGGHQYEDVSDAAGVADAGWGWGTSATDFDHDGLLDLVVTGGWFAGEWVGEQSYLFMNKGGFSFEEAALGVGFQHYLEGRGIVAFDYDNDGDQDMAIFSNDDALMLLRNDVSGDANWLRIFLDTSSDPALAPDGYGSTVKVTANGVTQTRSLCGGPTYLAQSELSCHYGLGSVERVERIEVTWADGTQKVWTGVKTNQVLTITP